MADNISVRITADVAELQAQFSVAKAESTALSSELSKLAKAWAQAKDPTDEMKAALYAAAQAAAEAKAKASDLGDALKTKLKPPADDATHSVSIFGQSLEELAGRVVALEAVREVADKLAEFVKDMSELGEQAINSAAMLGVSVQTYTRFAYAAGEAGVGADSARMALERLERNMADAQKGTGTAANAFHALGISSDDLKTKYTSLDALLPVLADKFAAAADGPNKTAIAMEIFGRAGAEMIPILDKGRSGLAELGDAGQAAGVAFDGPTAEGMKAVHDQLYALSGQLEGGAIALFNEFQPIILATAQALETFLTFAKQVVDSSEAWEIVWKPLIGIGEGLWDAVKGLGAQLAQLANQLHLAEAASAGLSAVWIVLVDSLKGVAVAVTGFVGGLRIAIDAVEGWAQDIGIATKLVAREFKDLVTLDMARANADWDAAMVAWEGSTRTHAKNIVDIIHQTAADIRTEMAGAAPNAAPGPDAEDGKKPQLKPPGGGGHGGDDARKLADELAAIHEQAEQKRIEGEVSTNAFLLAEGQESLAAFVAQAKNLEEQRYNIELDALKRKEANDAHDKAAELKDQAELEVLRQGHVNRMLAIDQDAQKRQEQLEQAALQEFERTQEDRLTAGIAELDEEFKNHQITAQQKHDLEVALTLDVEKQITDRLNAEIAGLTEGTTKYNDAVKARDAILKKFNADVLKADQQLAATERKLWDDTSKEISQGFVTAATTIFQAGGGLKSFLSSVAQSLEQAFEQAAEKMLEGWLDSFAQTETVGEQSSKVSATGQISAGAGITFANVYAQVSAIPGLWETAPGVATAASDTVLATGFGLASYAVGAWSLPSDQFAQVHKGEMIIPASFASALRSNVSNQDPGSGPTIAPHFHLHANDLRSGYSMMKQNLPEFARDLGRWYAMNPKDRGGY